MISFDLGCVCMYLFLFIMLLETYYVICSSIFIDSFVLNIKIHYKFLLFLLLAPNLPIFCFFIAVKYMKKHILDAKEHTSNVFQY